MRASSSPRDHGAAILRRIEQEAAPPSASGGEDRDWAELWGRRIGQTLGLLITLGILAWLAAFVIGG